MGEYATFCNVNMSKYVGEGGKLEKYAIMSV